MRRLWLGIAAALIFQLSSSPARAETLCDPAYQDCRSVLVNLIRNETVGIDVAFWFMEDSRYATEIINRFNAGVPVRVLVDTRANVEHPINAQILDQLKSAGIPMRQRVASGILHWKMMLFAGQGQIEFSGANYSPYGLVYVTPYSNYEDEAIMFSDELATVHSFMTRYDDLWTDTTSYANYANVSGALTRRYATYPISPEMNFPPSVSYRDRAIAAYDAESTAIDVNMFRITDRAHTDAIINAVERGVKVRLITEQEEYRNPDRLWDSWNVDRLCVAGVAIRQRGHDGINHEKSIMLRGQGMTIFGSSNWTTPSNQSQEEHNEFTTKSYVYQWFVNQFERKWNNGGPSPETAPFAPLPPDPPVYSAPANGATGVSTSPTLSFEAGPYAHLYDIYLGTSSNPPLIAVDVPLGPTGPGDSPRAYATPALAPGTTYYWRVVAKTMAEQRTGGPVWSFTTGGKPGPAPAPLPSPPPGPGPVSSCGAYAPPPPPPPPPPTTSAPAMSLDTPTTGAVLRQPFLIAGWALDAGATSGDGVDAVHVYAYPMSGGNPIFLGAAPVGATRDDVAAVYGAQFAPSGFNLAARGLAPGSYRIIAYEHSTVTGTFPLARYADVTVVAWTLLDVDTPPNGATVPSGFVIGGWTFDPGAVSGSGVDVVHAYAYPLDWAGGAIFLGAASVNVSRSDVAAVYGAQFTMSGYNLVTSGLGSGRYRIVVYAHSTVAGEFTGVATLIVTVR